MQRGASGRIIRVLIAGIDGYTGWPLALHLLSRGHDVAGIDNFVTRRRVREVGSWSATPIPSFARRQEIVRRTTGRSIAFHRIDVTRYEPVREVLRKERRDAIVHLPDSGARPTR